MIIAMFFILLQAIIILLTMIGFGAMIVYSVIKSIEYFKFNKYLHE